MKAPKIFIRDSGLLHALLNLATQRYLEGYPKLGASWEGFVIDQIVQQLGVNPDETFPLSKQVQAVAVSASSATWLPQFINQYVARYAFGGPNQRTKI